MGEAQVLRALERIADALEAGNEMVRQAADERRAVNGVIEQFQQAMMRLVDNQEQERADRKMDIERLERVMATFARSPSPPKMMQ